MKSLLAIAAATALCGGAPALAQKSEDTLRVAVTDQIMSLDPYYYQIIDAGFFYTRMYDTLVAYDTRVGKFIPQIAKSWRRVSDTVLEFDLRDDLTFHNGDKLSADDVVGTLGWARDPASKVPTTPRYYAWIKSIEKLGPYKVRITATEPNVTDLLLLSLRGSIYDNKLHASYADRSDYGRKTPVGTGPYKLAKLDTNSTILVERFDDAKIDRARAPIKRIQGQLIPDQQTQIAQFLVGRLDVLRNVNSANAENLEKDPRFATTNVDSLTFGFVSFDAMGRSGKKQLTDQRVRRALAMAIDRKELTGVVSGKDKARVMENMCFRETLGCDYSKQSPAYDPAGAKKLLAEAGYPDGFDLELLANTEMGDTGKAVVGYWRKIGVRATVQVMPTGVLRNKSTNGEITAQALFVPNDNLPDVNQPMRLIFGNDARDYIRDPAIIQHMNEGDAEMDQDKRRAIYKEAFDRIVDESFAVPLTTMPQVFSHTQSVKMLPGAFTDTAVFISDFVWAEGK